MGWGEGGKERGMDVEGAGEEMNGKVERRRKEGREGETKGRRTEEKSEGKRGR